MVLIYTEDNLNKPTKSDSKYADKLYDVCKSKIKHTISILILATTMLSIFFIYGCIVGFYNIDEETQLLVASIILIIAPFIVKNMVIYLSTLKILSKNEYDIATGLIVGYEKLGNHFNVFGRFQDSLGVEQELIIEEPTRYLKNAPKSNEYGNFALISCQNLAYLLVEYKHQPNKIYLKHQSIRIRKAN